MPRTRLRETLEELEQELGRTATIDAASRQRLDHVVGEVREILERTDESEERHQTLRDRLSEATREFEKDHPTLAEVVGRVAAALSNMGI